MHQDVVQELVAVGAVALEDRLLQAAGQPLRVGRQIHHLARGATHSRGQMPSSTLRDARACRSSVKEAARRRRSSLPSLI